MSFLESAQRWASFIERYGQPSEVSKEQAAELERTSLWSLCSLGNDVMINGLSQGSDVISYWKTPKGWSGESGVLVYEMTLWVGCPTCEEQSELDEDWLQDDCEECFGAGTMFIELEDCVEAQSDQEVFAQRQA